MTHWMDGRPVRIGYVADADPLDRWAWSGLHHYMFTALQDAGFEVEHPGARAKQRDTRASLWLDRALRAVGRPRPVVGADERARCVAAAIDEDLWRRPCDLLFAPVASRIVPRLRSSTPIVYLSDATFRLLRGCYPEVMALSAEVAGALDAVESAAIQRAALCVYTSDWAAASAIRDYGASPTRVRTICLGPNVDEIPERGEVHRRRGSGRLELLFLGRDWTRKGGDIAVEAVEALRGRGLEAQLLVCGVRPARALPPSVTVLDPVDKRKVRDRRRLRELLLSSQFLLLPTRADCAPTVVKEAYAHGLPVVTTRTGGLPTLVEDGVTGFLLPLEAGGEDYAACIAGAFATPAIHAGLVRCAREAYERRFNWSAWGDSMRREMLDLLAARAA